MFKSSNTSPEITTRASMKMSPGHCVLRDLQPSDMSSREVDSGSYKEVSPVGKPSPRRQPAQHTQ